MSKIFINIFILEPSEYVNELEGLLQNKETLEDLESFIEAICVKYKTDRYGDTEKQIACWDGFRKVCEAVRSGEYV